jgi:hypothetical protein
MPRLADVPRTRRAVGEERFLKQPGKTDAVVAATPVCCGSLL